MKNIDYVIKRIAKEKDLPEEVVSDVYKYYWKSVFDKLRNYNSPAISIPKIGTFYLSYVKLRKEIIEIIQRIKKIRKSDKLNLEKKDKAITYYKVYLKKLLERRKDLLPEYTETLKKLKNAGKLKNIY